MDAPWHFVFQGQHQGPVSGTGLLELALQGVLKEDTLVWQEGWPEWRKLSDTDLLAALPPAAKRQRVDGSAGGPGAEVVKEVAGWVQALDQRSTTALFEKALFHHLEDAIEGRPALRDALLAAYVKHHPASDDRNPAAYDLTDEFLLDAVEDFDSREAMWEVLGRDNDAAVGELIAAAAALDTQYCAQLQSLALLSRARRLLLGDEGGGSSEAAVAGAAAGGAGSAGEAAGRQLLGMLRDEPALALARDMEGRSLWHDLVEGERGDLLCTLLPAAVAPSSPAGGGGAGAEAPQQQGAAQQQQQQQPKQPKQPNPLNLPDHQGSTPLHLAAEASQLEAARLLVEAGASLDMQNRDPSKYASGQWSVKTSGLGFAIPVPSLHQTPLHIASEAGDLEMMGLLLAAGASLNLRDTAGSTPLHLALEAQDERAVALLLKAGANPMLANNNMGEGSTPLHTAAAAGQPRLLQSLLDAWPVEQLAAAVNQRGHAGWTPLMLAARRGNPACVRLLLERGADLTARNEQGRTAREVAEVNKRQAVVAMLAVQQQEGPVVQQQGHDT